MADGDVTVREIRKEVIEARGLVIQTHNLIENLNSELAKVAKRQVTYGRRYFLNSIIGYLLLLAVISISLYYVFDLRVQGAREETVRVRGELEETRAKLAALVKRQADRERAGQAALEVHEAMLARKKLAWAAAQYGKLPADDLDPVARRLLQDESKAVFLDEGRRSFEEGKNQSRRGRYAESIPHLDRAVALAPQAPFAAEALWRRGYGLYRSDRIRKAIPDFEKVLELDKESEYADDAAYHLAYSLEMLGEKEKAIAGYERLLAEYPRSDRASISRRKVDQLTRQAQKKTPRAAPAGTRGTGTQKPPPKPPPATPPNLTPPAE